MEYICSTYLEEELREIEMRDHEANEEPAENKQLEDLLEWKQEFTEFVEPSVNIVDHASIERDGLDSIARTQSRET